jgi:hypothetical protein
MTNWVYGADSGVDCPECGERTTGLDWVLNDAEEKIIAARVYPCRDQIPMPPWKFGPDARGTLKFTEVL